MPLLHAESDERHRRATAEGRRRFARQIFFPLEKARWGKKTLNFRKFTQRVSLTREQVNLSRNDDILRVKFVVEDISGISNKTVPFTKSLSLFLSLSPAILSEMLARLVKLRSASFCSAATRLPQTINQQLQLLPFS